MLGGTEDTLHCKQLNEVDISKVESCYNKPKKVHTIEVFSHDYICTKEDKDIIESIKSQPQNKRLVDIGGAFLTRDLLACLFDDTSHVNGNVLSAYIQLIRNEEHLRYRDGGKVFLENTFVSSVLKRDGCIDVELINPKQSTIETRVDNYLDHDMVFIPINIERFHWYLAVVNAQKCEIHVLDSLGDGATDRTDLKNTLIGLQRQINIVAQRKELKNNKWRDLQVAEWPVKEKITRPMQTDGSSCGLFMVNYMEYWTGTQLSDSVTQDDMKHFRSKLIAILWNSKLNTRKACLGSEHDSEHYDNEGESSGELEILDRPAKVCKKKNYVLSTGNIQMSEEELISMLHNYIKSISDANTLENFRHKLAAMLQEMKAHALSIRSVPVGEQELRDKICNYVMSIDHDEALEKEWVLSSKPYPIALNLKKIQGTLNKEQTMDVDCFSLAVRKLAFEQLNMLEGANKLVSKHYMDLKFYTACGFGRDPKYHEKVNVQQLAKLVLSWPWRNYDVTKCRLILIPLVWLGHFMLFVLDLKCRTISVLDPVPVNPAFKDQPLNKYATRIQKISNFLKRVMGVAYPTWNEDLIVWHHRIADGVHINVHSEVSGYYVLLFMRA